MRKIFWLIIIFGIILAAAGFWFWQKNPFSKEIVRLEIIGPDKIDLAKEVEYTVKYKNNGDVRLEEAKLIFEFPENTLLENGLSRIQEIGPEKLGDIYPGEEKVLSFKGRLIGKEGEVKTAKAVLNYHPKGLSAEYKSETDFATVIQSVPLNLDFDMPSTLQSGQNFDFSVNYFSRLDYILNNLELKLEYPDGFEVSKTTPKSLGNNEWQISALNKSEGGKISISGKISGGNKDQKTFKAILGIWEGDSFVELKETTIDTQITSANLFISQRINGQDRYTADPGNALHYEIFFKNNENSAFSNLDMEVHLEGRAFDFDSIRTDTGEFSKQNNTFVFSSGEVQKLKFLGKGEEGKVEFWINLKNDWQTSGPQERNFIVRDAVSVAGFSQTFDAKINSKIAVLQEAKYADEAFGNSGPFPAKPGQATTFTISWKIRNYYNNVKNVKIKAVLPQNVSLTGNIFPEQEGAKFSFDSKSREIVWTVSDGELPAGTGIFNNSPAIYFQISLNSISASDTLINSARVSAEDQWTGGNIFGTAPAILSGVINN